jgi:mannose-6-phosphate isomerase-like protein (cupin superfamily)
MNTEIDKPYAFKYEMPTEERPRTTVWLCRTDRFLADVQVLREGGEARLHSHSHLDGFWMVLSGRVRFHWMEDANGAGDGREVITEVGRYEGTLIPRGTKYWFETVGPEPVELLQLEVSDVAMPTMDAARADKQYYDEAVGVAVQHEEARSLSDGR